MIKIRKAQISFQTIPASTVSPFGTVTGIPTQPGSDKAKTSGGAV